MNNSNENIICNEKTEVLSSKNINDNDILVALNESLKNMCVNMTITLNEVSNDNLYKKLFSIYKETKDMQRDVFELLFAKGWYKIEKVDTNKVKQKYTELDGKMKEIS